MQKCVCLVYPHMHTQYSNSLVQQQMDVAASNSKHLCQSKKKDEMWIPTLCHSIEWFNVVYRMLSYSHKNA